MGNPTAPDNPGISPWAPRQPLEHQRLNALQGAVLTDITVGPGLRVIRQGNRAVVSLKDQVVPITAFWVRVAGTTGATGIYIGHRLDTSAAVNIAGVDLSTEWKITGEEIAIVNVYEPPDGSGHSLLEEPKQLDHLATWGGSTSEAPVRRVAFVQALSFNECEGDIDGGTF